MDNQDKIINKIKSAAQKAEHQDFPGMDKVWARVEDKLDQKVLETKTKLWKKLAIAASLLLFVSLGYQFFKKDSKNDAIIESTSIKVAVQKEKTLNDSIIPSDKIKPEATEILQKQLEKPNPVAIIENHATPDNDANLISPNAKAEEALTPADANINQEPNNTLSVAPIAPVATKSLAPAVSELKEKADFFATDKNTTKTISGIITDENDQPIPRANVSIKGTKNIAVTNWDGKYTIQAEKGEQILFNTLGYNNAYAIVGNSNEINKKLTSHSNALNEVVVVGYGSRKAKLAAAKAEITNNEVTTLSKKKTVPHVKDALYIINGAEYSEASLFGSKPTSPYAPLSKQKIETVQVLQKEEATAIYGNKSNNGVIIITTENGIPLKR